MLSVCIPSVNEELASFFAMYLNVATQTTTDLLCHRGGFALLGALNVILVTDKIQYCIGKKGGSTEK